MITEQMKSEVLGVVNQLRRADGRGIYTGELLTDWQDNYCPIKRMVGEDDPEVMDRMWASPASISIYDGNPWNLGSKLLFRIGDVPWTVISFILDVDSRLELNR